MSLYKRGRIWWCEWKIKEISSRPIRESTGTTDRQAAQEYHDRRRAELWRETKLGDVRIATWDEAALSWVDEHACHKKSYETDRIRLLWLQPHLTGKPISDITTDFMIELRKQKTGSNATINRHLAVVSAVLNHARAKGWLAAVPKTPYLPEPKQRIRWITQQQASDLIANLPDHLAAMARFALATGLRRSNVTGLLWQDVDLDRSIAWVWGDEAKAGKPIGVPLNADAMAVLRGQQGQDARYVFVWRRKPVIETNTKAFKDACKEAGIVDFTWHDLRHTWASWHIQNGTPLEVLQRLGGWADYGMVLKYAHLAQSHIAHYAGNVALGGPRKNPHTTVFDSLAKSPEEPDGAVGWPMGLEPTTTGITIPFKKKKHA